MNPLLDFSGLPRFPELRPEHVAPAVEQLLADGREVIARIERSSEPPTWDSVVRPLEDANERISRAWSQVSHLNAVMNTPALREAYNACLPKITQYYAELGQNQVLFAKYKAMAASPAFETLTRAQKRVIENELRDFRLGGAELPPPQRARFLEIQERLAQASSRFSDHLLDATDAFAYYATQEEIAGIPRDVLEAAREAAKQDGKTGWKFTLHTPSYLPVMQYADHRPLRETMYRAYVTRASDLGPAELDNTPLIREILKLRAEEARLLGFRNYAQLSLEPKMAESPEQVLAFLHELAAKARPAALRELAELEEFAAKELKLDRLEAWDLAYAAEKLRLARYAFSEQEVKQYFPETTVLPGMFRLVETLYGVRIERAEAPVWHPDVKFFRITSEQGELVGQFYVDLYARPSKRGGAWMDEAISRRRLASGVQVPVAYLTCNFSPPVGGKPALLTHDEVITLFHEFGHGLHHLLTQVDELGVAGINGVEWDAVELPSQFMENFCWEWDVVRPMTAHVDTAEPLPKGLFDKMVAAKNFQVGMQTVRQLEFALFDMRLHYDFDPEQGDFMQLLDEVRRQVAVVFPPPYNRFPHSFSHIFAGGYAAGYYSYKWAEVLSADAYSLFEEHGVLCPEIGRRFRDEILAVGGSRPALESFVAFRGREPRIEALLRHSGMITETA
ncbi:M3 family metallopeptidase [Pelomicrobium methylotrophicum]|uniref:oligopeptidase A n=1 Tax=Pelomicrobium methylotrophicum TaxID=2602750 RepID=A0A5C7EL83_9PROT|nr:M3 family metallopeptidase [Pelomicrobium methylotrophicum]TXF13400.1 M3 family metallopeptidase [Pelomicrobium methylotrophicum]